MNHTIVMMKKTALLFTCSTKLAMTLALAVVLAACGGGGSSSGSDVRNSFAGTYEGGGDTDFTIGDKTANNYTPTKIIISPDGKVDASDGSANIRTSGNLNEVDFTTRGTFTNTNNGLDCMMTTQYTGAIRLDNGILTATGKLSGTGQCNGDPSSFTGVYSARKISDVAKSPVNSGLEDNFRTLVQ